MNYKNGTSDKDLNISRIKIIVRFCIEYVSLKNTDEATERIKNRLLHFSFSTKLSTR